MKKITDKIICAMKNKNISIDEEVVKFGLEIIFMKILFAVVVTLLGILMNCFFDKLSKGLIFLF